MNRYSFVVRNINGRAHSYPPGPNRSAPDKLLVITVMRLAGCEIALAPGKWPVCRDSTRLPGRDTSVPGNW